MEIEHLQRFSVTLTLVRVCLVARDARFRQSGDRHVFRSSQGARNPQERSTLSIRFNLCENCYKSAIARQPSGGSPRLARAKPACAGDSRHKTSSVLIRRIRADPCSLPASGAQPACAGDSRHKTSSVPIRVLFPPPGRSPPAQNANSNGNPIGYQLSAIGYQLSAIGWGRMFTSKSQNTLTDICCHP